MRGRAAFFLFINPAFNGASRPIPLKTGYGVCATRRPFIQAGKTSIQWDEYGQFDRQNRRSAERLSAILRFQNVTRPLMK